MTSQRLGAEANRANVHVAWLGAALERKPVEPILVVLVFLSERLGLSVAAVLMRALALL